MNLRAHKTTQKRYSNISYESRSGLLKFVRDLIAESLYPEMLSLFHINLVLSCKVGVHCFVRCFPIITLVVQNYDDYNRLYASVFLRTLLPVWAKIEGIIWPGPHTAIIRLVHIISQFLQHLIPQFFRIRFSWKIALIPDSFLGRGAFVDLLLIVFNGNFLK